MTLRELLDQAADKTPRRKALRYKSDGLWHAFTYAELRDEVELLAEAFATLKIQPRNDKVALILDNQPEWIVSYFALAGCGVAVVPIDPKLSTDEIEFVLRDSEAVAVVLHANHLQSLHDMLTRLPSLHSAIVLTDSGTTYPNPVMDGLSVYSYAQLRENAASQSGRCRYDECRAVGTDVASIIYTSGTMGIPKGAMLTHNNFCSDVSGSLAAIDHALSSSDDFLVVLPLFHSFSFTANLLLAFACGAGLGFVENLRSVADDMRELQPTIVMAVPLLCEKILHKVNCGLRDQPFARWLLRMGLGGLLGRAVKRKLGGRLRYIIVGGAPCPVDLIRGFGKIGVSLVEGYGLTECSPVVAFPKLTAPRVGTIGKKLPNVEVRIAEPDQNGVGELQVRGPMVMKGYYRNLPATREAFDAEWLRTGDLASIDADGFITIRGRKKALIVNREGKNIYPEEVENVIALDSLLSDVVVLGYRVGNDPGERVGVIIAPDEELLKNESEVDCEDESAVKSFVRRRLAVQCQKLATYKHPRKMIISRKPLERTSLQKVRRCLYQGQLDEGECHQSQ
jgi:long-chain acyl-CoA synthetase